MQAFIAEAKHWKDGTMFPILTIMANGAENSEELKALHQIEEALAGLAGKAYAEKLCTTQKGSGQQGLFTVDLSAVLTLLKELKQVRVDHKEASRGWITNWLKGKVRPDWMPKVHAEKEEEKVYTCRCGMEYKVKSGSSKKKMKRRFLTHQKRCAYLKSLSGLFDRCERLLERKDDARKKEKSVNKGKIRKAKGSQSGKTSKERKAVDRRTKARRTKRNHRKDKK